MSSYDNPFSLSPSLSSNLNSFLDELEDIPKASTSWEGNEEVTNITEPANQLRRSISHNDIATPEQRNNVAQKLGKGDKGFLVLLSAVFIAALVFAGFEISDIVKGLKS